MSSSSVREAAGMSPAGLRLPPRQARSCCRQNGGKRSIMNPITYSLFAYGLTAVISYVVIAIIVAINACMSRSHKKGTGGRKEG